MSAAEDQLAQQLLWARLPHPRRGARFHPTRKWEFDFAWESHLFAVEVDGGGFINGRHSRGTGIEKDCEKFAEAMLLGWRILRVTPAQIKSGRALQWIEKLLHQYRPGACAPAPLVHQK